MLNPLKCAFGVQTGKFVGFMITRRGIKVNPDKCRAILDMSSPGSMKEVQSLAGRFIALSRFMSKAVDKTTPLFNYIKKAKNFVWTLECEEAFQQIKAYLATPLMLTKPDLGKDLLLYLSVSDRAISLVLVKEEGREQKPIYFVGKIFQEAETRYQKIEKVGLAIVTTARRLWPYFQSHQIIFKIDQLIKQILSILAG